MRFACEFEHASTGACKTVVTSLRLSEIEAVESIHQRNGDEIASVTAMSYALRQAYAELPRGFYHTAPPALILVS